MVGRAVGWSGVYGLWAEPGGDGGSAEEAGLCGRGAGEPAEDGGEAAGERRVAAAPGTSQQVNSGGWLIHYDSYFKNRKHDRISLSLSRLVADALPPMLECFESVIRLSASRRAALEDRLRLYVFEREATELQTWLTSKKTSAESEDCGQDLEDVEVSLVRTR